MAFFIICEYSLIQRKVLGQLCCLAEGRHRIGENLTAGTQGSEAAEERQEQVDSEATVGPRCFEQIVFKLHFLGNLIKGKVFFFHHCLLKS